MVDLSQFSLEGRIALVTGASSGIGHRVAKGLASAGARVAVAARRRERLEDLLEEIATQSGEATAITLDVTDRDSIKRCFDTITSQFDAPAEIIINNAGIGMAKNFLNMEPEDLDATMQTNFYGVHNVGQEAAKRLVAANAPGSIINIASILGLGGRRAHTAYSASKAAVVNLTRSMALDLQKHQIRVNAIAPGYFVTEITESYFETEHGKEFISRTPAGAPGNIDHLVGPIIMLASDAGAFVNGVVLPVDGAHTATWI